MDIQTLKNTYETQKKSRENFLSLFDKKSFDFQIATWFGSGLIVPAPGTWGTVGGVLAGLLLLFLTNSMVVLIVAVALYFIGIQSVERMEKKSGLHDPSFIVIDEVVAIMVGIAILPTSYFAIHLLVLFLLFRYFDAKKPWLIGWVDKNIKGARGVMLDDMVAILFAIVSWWLLSFIALFIAFPTLV